MAETSSPYPVTLSIDFPDRPLDKLTTFFRPFVAIPILIIIGLLAGGTTEVWEGASWSMAYGAGGAVVLPTLLMILFRQKYPRWWFDWNLNLARFGTRVEAYMLLLRDEYPSTDEEQAVHLEIPYPDAEQELHRGMPLVKWLLAVPHYIVLAFLYVAVVVCVIGAWFAILFTGRYPRSLFGFIVGVMRWSLRVAAYAFLLVTDKYPPFALSE